MFVVYWGRKVEQRHIQQTNNEDMMKAIVVYESLWGNTAAIARAIAEGLGPGARALSTAEATSEAIADADLIVAGAPVHSLSLPTDKLGSGRGPATSGPGERRPISRTRRCARGSRSCRRDTVAQPRSTRA
ncbi:MAG: hypothetical protein J7M16_03140 [Anaerolineae bacterium]|nr:hypothetical protein [Anaerolineae bacterium]